jgi:alpha-D-ribose 1-methylphosphonate 5-triphosphate synthase subunit PhnH
MASVPHHSEAERRANAAFDTLLRALSRPGLPHRLPAPGEAPVIEALLDRECRVHSTDPRLIPAIIRTGATVTDLAAADHVFLGRMAHPAALGAVSLGSDLYPDEGATVVLQATFGRGARLRLSGPGVDGAHELRIGGLPEGVWQTRTGLIRYPTGFDLFLLDGADAIGLPRSTTVEML